MTTAVEQAPAAAPAPPAVQRIFTATLILGVPGAGKTSLFKTFAEYLWETYGRVLLLYSWDGGAIPTDVQKLMKQGLIRFWRARTRSAPGLGIETLYKATRGHWPRQINPITGETSPAVVMVPPVTTKYDVWCAKGHPLKTVISTDLIGPIFCSDCKDMQTAGMVRVQETMTRTKGFELVGGVGFDGLTSMTNVVMEHMDHERGAGNIGGEKAAFGGVVVSGSIKLGGNNRADVGFGQSRAQQLVNNSLSIPYLVEGPVFTALSMEATDEGGLAIVGAKLPGRAATDEASSWFGNVCEMGKTLDDQGKQHFTLYLRPFTDAQGRRHLLKTSASPSGVPEKLIDPPEDAMQAFTVANLGYVFRLLDEDLRKAMAQEIPNAPGVPSEYGEAALTETQPAGMAAPPTGMPASGIPPLATPARQVTGALPAVASPVGVVTGGMPVMKAKARGKAAAVPPAAVPPVAEGQPTAPVETAPLLPAPQQQQAPLPIAAKAPTAIVPPPPGMRPPQRAPGT